jgi:biopolymer transport protein ExbB
MKKLMRSLLLALLLVPIMASAGSWWSNDWKFRKEITFDLSTAAADVANSVDELPVLIRLSAGNFGYFGDVKPDGSDFRFVAGDDKTPLKFHVERFDSQNQMAFLWVRVPKLVGGSKTDKIYLYYGNPDAASAGEAASTYDADQSVVAHFGGDGLPRDETAYKNNFTESSAEAASASFSASGLKFTGKETAKIPASPSLELTGKGVTLSAWVKFDGPQTANATIVSASDGAREIALAVQGLKPIARVLGASISGSADVVAGAWHHLAVTVGGGKAVLYVDGVIAGNTAATITTFNAAISVGSGFVGDLDEVEVSRTVRTPDWIKASVKAQGPEGNLLAYGADGQKEGGGGSYIGIIAKNLTADGWVVIGICFFMLLVAIVLMVMKALYLSRVERANAAFLDTYSKISGDVTTIPTGRDGSTPNAEWSSSTLFRLYATGMDELFKRIVPGKVSVEGVYLSEQSIEAIRASIDGSMTRMQQHLSARMVLLTIAISGGPFLGLLGTVVGVMITFAAIAAAGDVNVNAIAPGVAAALAATVAGLLVAIPSLFGYNWLNTRIKAVAADNRVFADEVIARLAEQHTGER